MTAKEYNQNFWCVASTPLFSRRPISFPVLTSLLGSKIYVVFRKLEQSKNQKLIVRPFHGHTYIFYRH